MSATWEGGEAARRGWLGRRKRWWNVGTEEHAVRTCHARRSLAPWRCNGMRGGLGRSVQRLPLPSSPWIGGNCSQG
eukprot:scaffold8646_cov115-Isochrysis_galbana.AAC.6